MKPVLFDIFGIDDYLTNEKLTVNSGGSEGYLNPEQTKELSNCDNYPDIAGY